MKTFKVWLLPEISQRWPTK